MKEKDCEISEIANDNLEDKTQLRVKVLGGYDGFGGTHDNLKWLIREASIVYTMNNKIVFEKTKNKEQIFLNLS
jgi:hypothetical protein